MTTSHTDVILPEGEELLNGLHVVQKHISEIEKLQLTWGDLAKQLRDYIVDMNTAKGKTQYSLFVMGVCIAAWAGLAALLTGNIFSFVAVLVVVALYFVGKAKKKEKMFKWALLILAFICIQFLFGSISFAVSNNNYGSLIISLVLLGIAIFVSQVMLKRHKAKIDAHNAELHTQMNDAWQKIKDSEEKMLSFSSSWYPQDYYFADAIEHFIKYVANHQARTVEAMVNRYADEVAQERRHQEKMARLDQIIGNQKEMMKMMRFSNMLSVIAAGANIVTALNTSEIASNTSLIASNTSSIASDMGAMARKFKAKW